ncbi:MAG: glycosyltransferase family 4 protein [Lentisphaerae bacterium]|nr:glycosyltransferase family 4 protein [Lentisphaerota bacterium]
MNSSPRVLLLATEAYGCRGGIATFNRNLCQALTAAPVAARVTVVPRRLDEALAEGALPPAVTQMTAATGGGLRFWVEAIRAARRGGPVDLILCGHLYLLPTAVLLRALTRAPMAVVLYGIEAWQPPRRRLLRGCARRLDHAIAISTLTLERFAAWSGHPSSRSTVLPCAVDLSRFTPGPRPAERVAALGLQGRRVLLTLARLDASERYKGIDEVLDALVALRAGSPDLVYLVAGDGSDRPRLEDRARQLGLQDAVRFLGYVPEADKVDLYRLADAFVMPGRGEGFGIVYLEAMACGIPVVASRADASQEAVRGGLLGELADPADTASVREAIRRALARPRGVRPDGLEVFTLSAFTERVQALLAALLKGAGQD